MISLEHELLNSGILVRGNFVLASGRPASQKLDWDLINPASQVFNRVVKEMAERVKQYAPDAIIAVPNGANLLAKRVADLLEISFIETKKTTSSRFALVGAKTDVSPIRLLLVDDIFTTGTNMSNLCSDLGLIPMAGIVVWDRSAPGDRPKIDFPLISLVKRYIPLEG
ncbi:hypothetical protein KC878_04005 [Candidatus Saccharibacteria bacterium]|nr:hypothetical protein [Candidatus Saccharibacteria bacterium]MCB9820926.1 hypothetical protein [Candidatus Nomurabacteria bacterium]